MWIGLPPNTVGSSDLNSRRSKLIYYERSGLFERSIFFSFATVGIDLPFVMRSRMPRFQISRRSFVIATTVIGCGSRLLIHIKITERAAEVIGHGT